LAQLSEALHNGICVWQVRLCALARQRKNGRGQG
jgi:hypothetical protein